MNNFDGIPGVIYMTFCTFCPTEAAGEVTVFDGGEIKVPVCEPCRDKLFDNGLDAMVN